jgi:hypothetical protein
MKASRLARRLAAAVTLALVGAAGVSHANSEAAAPGLLAPGAIELTPNVSFNHSSTKREGYGNVDTFTRFDFTPTVGFCLTDRFEATSGVTLRHVRENDNHQTALGFTAGLLYNFPSRGTMIPFAGIGFGAIFNDGFTFNETALIAPSLTGGMRLLVGSTASVNLSLGYQHETDNHVSTNQLLGSVGVSLFPWRVR